jgi:hypothetical protein
MSNIEDRKVSIISYGILYMPILAFIGVALFVSTSFRCLIYSKYLLPGVPIAVCTLFILFVIIYFSKFKLQRKLKILLSCSIATYLFVTAFLEFSCR